MIPAPPSIRKRLTEFHAVSGTRGKRTQAEHDYYHWYHTQGAKLRARYRPQ